MNSEMKILVGSKNPVKTRAARKIFRRYYDEVEVLGIGVLSGVSDQPVGEETFEGAKNRVEALVKVNRGRELEADFLVGIEGGIIELNQQWFGMGVVHIRDREGREGTGLTPHFPLPEYITQKLLKGTELGEMMDRITGKKNTKRKAGAIGFLSKGQMKRQQLYEYGIISAMVPFVQEEMFFAEAEDFVS